MAKSKAKRKENELKRFKANEEKIKNAGLIQVTNSKRKKGYKCLKCNTIFYAYRKQVTKNPICRNCMTGKSYGEQVAINVLIENNIDFEKEKTFPKLKGLGNGKLRYDFYIKKPNGENFIIEIDGEQHSDSEWSKNTKEHDIIKNKFCIDNNIKLYRVNYIFGKLDYVANSVLGILVNEGYNINNEIAGKYIEVKSKEDKAKKTSKKKKSNKKYYAIKVGRQKNKIVTTWNKCKSLVHGYPNAKFKGFETKEEAEKYLGK